VGCPARLPCSSSSRSSRGEPVGPRAAAGGAAPLL
jgi:hypothetical protein